MGIGLAVVALLIALGRGAFGKTWNVTLPQIVVGIGDSCLVVPCHFSVPDDQEGNILRCPDGGVWRMGNMQGPIILNSPSPFTNVIEGQVLGDLTKKNCTTVFHNFPVNYSNAYFFRLDCPAIKFTFSTGVGIMALADPAPPQLAAVPVLSEGDPVRLQCSVPVPCSLRPPALSWQPNDGSMQEATQMLQNADGQMVMTSTLTFVASADHHDQSITCGVSYPLTKGGSTKAALKTRRLNVLYAPRATVAALGPSGRVVTCSSDANPPVSRYVWYRDGGNPSVSGEGETLVLPVGPAADGLYLCEAHNSQGSQRSRPVSLGIGSASGTAENSFYALSGVMLGLYTITVIVIVYKCRSFSRRLMTLEQKEESVYTGLKSCRCVTSSDYDQIQPKEKPSSGSSAYENTQGRSRDQQQLC